MSDLQTNESAMLKTLEERVEKLERQMAALLKKSAAPQSRARDHRDRYDALDYPER